MFVVFTLTLFFTFVNAPYMYPFLRHVLAGDFESTNVIVVVHDHTLHQVKEVSFSAMLVMLYRWRKRELNTVLSIFHFSVCVMQEKIHCFLYPCLFPPSFQFLLVKHKTGSPQPGWRWQVLCVQPVSSIKINCSGLRMSKFSEGTHVT